jgi:glycogen debranching enzyme
MTDDPVAEEEPGKILHEVRRDGGGGLFAKRGRYFRRVDATPLFVVTVAEAWQWGALGPTTLERLVPTIGAAVGWLAANAAARRVRVTPAAAMTEVWSTRGRKDSPPEAADIRETPCRR